MPLPHPPPALVPRLILNLVLLHRQALAPGLALTLPTRVVPPPPSLPPLISSSVSSSSLCLLPASSCNTPAAFHLFLSFLSVSSFSLCLVHILHFHIITTLRSVLFMSLLPHNDCPESLLSTLDSPHDHQPRLRTVIGSVCECGTSRQ